jgi:hypothetical protein
LKRASVDHFRYYYASGLALFPLLYFLFGKNHWIAFMILGLLLFLDGVCFALIFFATGKRLQSLGSPNRQIYYFCAFLLVTIVFAVFVAKSLSFTETLNRPFLGMDVLSGKTFDHGSMTYVGLVIVTSQACAMALAFLAPRELLGFVLHRHNREK